MYAAHPKKAEISFEIPAVIGCSTLPNHRGNPRALINGVIGASRARLVAMMSEMSSASGYEARRLQKNGRMASFIRALNLHGIADVFSELIHGWKGTNFRCDQCELGSRHIRKARTPVKNTEIIGHSRPRQQCHCESGRDGRENAGEARAFVCDAPGPTLHLQRVDRTLSVKAAARKYGQGNRLAI